MLTPNDFLRHDIRRHVTVDINIHFKLSEMPGFGDFAVLSLDLPKATLINARERGWAILQPGPQRSKKDIQKSKTLYYKLFISNWIIFFKNNITIKNENRQQTGYPENPLGTTDMWEPVSRNNFLTWATAVVQRMFNPTFGRMNRPNCTCQWVYILTLLGVYMLNGKLYML